MSFSRLLLAAVLLAVLGAPPVASADEKDDKAKAKAKPPARSFSDEDLKKYKDKPDAGSAESSAAAQVETPADSSNPSGEGEGGARRRRRRSSESGGEQPSTTPVAEPGAQAKDQAPFDVAEGASPEEIEWKGRAAAARRPLDEARGRIATIESEMAELKDRLNPMSTNYVLGGNSTAGPGAVYEIEEKLRNLETQRIDVMAEMAQADKAWQSFLEEARAAGASPAWLNP